MIVRESGTKTLSCDDCGESLDQTFPDGQFNDLINYAKSQSWSIKPDGQGDWQHLCMGCRPGTGSKLAAQRKLLGL